MKPSLDILRRVEALLGSKPVDWRAVTGGYSIAERWSLDLADGRRVFAKMATTDDIARRLRDEHAHTAALDADFVCDVLAFEDGERPLMIVDDLSHGRWPPPWRAGDVERVMETFARIARHPIPGHVPDHVIYDGMFTGWQEIAKDPAGFLALEIGSRAWLDDALPALLDAERRLDLSGEDFVHGDAWSSNICLLEDGVKLVDWNFAFRGNGAFDRCAWLPALRLEGGPLPEEVVAGAGDWAAALSGFFAHNATQPIPEGAPTVRPWQKRQARMAIPWACRELGLPLPDVPYAMREIARVDAQYTDGEIDEDMWHMRVEEPLIDAYLATADPRAGSGKSGDETDWRWSRELILEVFPQRATFLDVGCANGYLMESVHRWGAEHGIDVEPYGVDISWRIVSLARLRLPHWADRIFVANAFDWTPPMRFDVVQIGIDEVPGPRRAELVERVLRDYLVPGGKLVCRSSRASGEYDPGIILDRLGFRPAGMLAAVHPHTGQLRTTAWLQAPVG